MNPESFFRRRIVAPILAQLRQGVAPERIALALAVGAVVGIFPILGVSTALCAGLGVWLRLNQPVIQLVNYLMYPLQLALLIPFCRAGERALRYGVPARLRFTSARQATDPSRIEQRFSKNRDSIRRKGAPGRRATLRRRGAEPARAHAAEVKGLACWQRPAPASTAVSNKDSQFQIPPRLPTAAASGARRPGAPFRQRDEAVLTSSVPEVRARGGD